MKDSQSISVWLDGIKAGNVEAARALWERYFTSLLNLARKRLSGSRRRIADEEDVVLSAFQSFCAAAAAGRFPRLEDSDDLWRLLVTITERKAWRQMAAERREKRGGGLVRGDSVVDIAGAGFDVFSADEPTPEFALLVAEETGRLLELLDSDALREVALLKMQGYTVEEIADQASCSSRSVKRKLALIREIWRPQLSP